MKNIYELAATNLSHARKRYGNTEPLHAHVKEGDLVLIKNNVRKAFEPRYVGTFRVVIVKGQQVEVRPAEGGRTQMVHISHVKNILPADNIIKQLPDYTHFGRKTKLRLNPERIPDLKWNLAVKLNTTPKTETVQSIMLSEITVSTYQVNEPIMTPNFNVSLVKKKKSTPYNPLFDINIYYEQKPFLIDKKKKKTIMSESTQSLYF